MKLQKKPLWKRIAGSPGTFWHYYRLLRGYKVGHLEAIRITLEIVAVNLR